MIEQYIWNLKSRLMRIKIYLSELHFIKKTRVDLVINHENRENPSLGHCIMRVSFHNIWK